jgi:hypothetical protein
MDKVQVLKLAVLERLLQNVNLLTVYRCRSSLTDVRAVITVVLMNSDDLYMNIQVFSYFTIVPLDVKPNQKVSKLNSYHRHGSNAESKQN